MSAEGPGDRSAYESLDVSELVGQCAELELILDAIPALVFYKDLENRILRVNRATADAMEVEPDRMRFTRMKDWLPEGADERDERDLEALRSGQARFGAIEHLALPGGRRWFETTRLPQRDVRGQVCGLVVLAQDITERRQLEMQLLQTQKLESIGKLAGGLAHDFNNLLTSIFGLITVAQRSLPSESEAHEYLSLMHMAAEGGANLTKQLLAFARRQIIEPRVVDLNQLVRETAELLSRALGERFDVRLELAGETLPVRADSVQISQLLMNLALNARDAMGDAGRLTFKTELIELKEPEHWSLAPSASGRFIKLSVADTGGGFSEEAKEHLFEPFFTTKALGQGTGLGLATCYGIAKQNNGHIVAESKVGEGATFTIYLPEADAPVDSGRAPRTFGPVRAGNETILFVEDDDLVRYLAVAALASSGYRLIEAASGEEALKAVEEHGGPIHLLVTDIIMPQMCGVELAKRFGELRPEAPVLFISGYAGEGLPEFEGEVLPKPFTNDELFARVRRLLDEPKGQAANVDHDAAAPG